MMTDKDCEEEEYEAECWRRDVEQGITCGRLGDDRYGTNRTEDEPLEEE